MRVNSDLLLSVDDDFHILGVNTCVKIQNKVPVAIYGHITAVVIVALNYYATNLLLVNQPPICRLFVV